MDIDYYNDGSHSGSGLGTSDNGPVPVMPGSPGSPVYPVSSSAGTPIESDTKIDGLADAGFDPNGANSEVGPQGTSGSAPSPDSIPQPASGQVYPTTRTYPS